MSISATVLRVLSTIIGALLPKGKQIYAERSAGKAPESVPIDVAEEVFDEALNRLGAFDVDHPWWKHALFELGGSAIRPDWFKKPHIQEWLSQAEVRRLLKMAARADLTGARDRQEDHDALVLSYMENSYENRRHAESAISLAVAVLNSRGASRAVMRFRSNSRWAPRNFAGRPITKCIRAGCVPIEFITFPHAPSTRTSCCELSIQPAFCPVNTSKRV